MQDSAAGMFIFDRVCSSTLRLENLDVLIDLVASREHRVQGSHSVLDDQGNLAAPYLAHLVFGA